MGLFVLPLENTSANDLLFCVFGDGPAAALLTYGDSNGGAVNLYSIGATSSFCGCS